MNDSYITKKHIINQLEARFPDLTARDVEEGVSLIINTIIETVEQGGQAQLRGIGTFKRTIHNARQARNPRTGELVALPIKYRFRYKPSSLFHALLNENNTENSNNG